MQLDTEKLANDAMQDPAKVNLVHAVKRSSISHHLEARGILASVTLVPIDFQEALKHETDILNATNPDRFMLKNRVQILAEHNIDTAPMEPEEAIEHAIFTRIVAAVGGSIEFDHDNLQAIRRQAAQMAVMRSGIDAMDRMCMVQNILLSVVRQRVRDIFCKSKLTKQSPVGFTEIDDPENAIIFSVREGFDETVERVNAALGLNLQIPKG